MRKHVTLLPKPDNRPHRGMDKGRRSQVPISSLGAAAITPERSEEDRSPSGTMGRDEPDLDGSDRGLPAVLDPELEDYALDAELNGAQAVEEFARDLRVCETRDYLAQHFNLPARQGLGYKLDHLTQADILDDAYKVLRFPGG